MSSQTARVAKSPPPPAGERFHPRAYAAWSSALTLIDWNENNGYDIFIDASVDTGDIDDRLSDDSIRQKIRDQYLRDSSVTILLVGTETKNRKHVDWEVYSSMFDGQVNKKSGVLVIQLPSTGCTTYTAAHGDEEKRGSLL